MRQLWTVSIMALVIGLGVSSCEQKPTPQPEPKKEEAVKTVDIKVDGDKRVIETPNVKIEVNKK